MLKARFFPSLIVLAFILSIIPGMAMAANNADILESQSSVSSSMSPGETRQVQIKVKNTGTTTWRGSALDRLGADSSINQVDWSGFACGGYRNHTADQRVFLCHDVGPGGTHTFTFNITMPSGATGSRILGVQMVQDGVQWFGERGSWAISVASDSSGVTVFEHCDYGGYRASLPVGDYRLSDLINRGIRNDDLSSIEVPGDYRATLYEHDNFQGDSWVVDADTSCFVAFGWNDRVSSMRVELNGGGGFPNSITGGLPKGPFGSGGQTDAVTEPGNWRWSEWFYGHQGIDRIAWQYDGCGGLHNYAMGWHGNDLIEYLMKFGGEYSRLVLRGIADRPGPVELAIYIDGQYKASVAWDGNDDCNEDVVIDIGDISYGTHAIAVQFINDYYNPPEDRNFYLDGLLVERSTAPPPPPPPSSELYGLCVNANYPEQNPPASEFSELGVQWARSIRYQNGFTPSQMNVNWLVIFNQETIPRRDGETWSQYVERFSNEVRTIVQANAWISAIEVWNEQDLPDSGCDYCPGWGRYITPQDYAPLLRATYQKVKGLTDPPIIVFGGMGSGAYAGADYLQQVKNQWGGSIYFDAVGLHPYLATVDGIGWPHHGNMEDSINHLYNYTSGRPIWLTEFGAAYQHLGGDKNQQGLYLEKCYQLFERLKHGNKRKVEVAFWFAWDDRTHWNPNAESFGLVEQDRSGSPDDWRRPAWWRYYGLTHR